MAHSPITVADEQYIFRPETRNKFLILLGVGIALFILGLILDMSSGGHDAHGTEGHAMVNTQELTASTDATPAQDQEHHEAAAGAHHETAHWLKRLYTTRWMNNVFFTGLGIIGLFFVAIQYAAQAGWSAGLIRIPLSMGNWIPIAGILMLVLFFITNHTVFHWSHGYLYEEGNPQYDEIIAHKAKFFFWPGEGGGFPIFYILRMVLFFGMWYWFYTLIRKNLLAED